jgi:hypothetical protein
MLVLHLGHQGSPCSLPGVSAVYDWEDADFSGTPDETLNLGDDHGYIDEHGIVKVTIVDSAGVFQRRFHFCKCPNAASCWEQLFQGGFWPASLRRPQTAFTLNVLCQFHYASLEAKVAASAFYTSLCCYDGGNDYKKLPVSAKLY